jgi:large subunit ribosomal protein L28
MLSRYQLLAGRLSSPRAILYASQAPPRTAAPRTYATVDSPPPVVVQNPLKRRKKGDLGAHLPKHIIPADTYMPPYPHGDHALFKQANRGLYGDQRIQFGNNVSVKTETKTRRDWKPNVLNKALYSVALKKKIKLRITARVLKTMDREGGLDEYLLKDDEHRVKELGPLGWALRWTLMRQPVVIDRMRSHAAALGVDQALIDQQWPTPEMQAEQRKLASGYVKASDVVGDVYDEPEDQDAYSDVYDEPLPTEPQQKQTRARTIAAAGIQYEKAIKAAQRYVDRGIVDNKETGIKLAFLREKQRVQNANRNKQNFKAKLEEQFSDEHVKETRNKFDIPDHLSDLTVRNIAYNQWRREQIQQLGSYEAWRAKRQAEHAQRVAEYKAQQGQASSEPRPDKHAALLAEAERAATDKTMNWGRKAQLEGALKKADMMIQAIREGQENAKETYVRAVTETYVRARAEKENAQSNNALGV